MRRALALALCALAGCYTVRFRRNVEAEPAPRMEKWHHDAVDGLLEVSDPVDVDAVCPGGVAETETQVTFLNALADVLVQGAANYVVVRAAGPAASAAGTPGLGFRLWSPSTVRVTCARSGAAPPPVPVASALPVKKPLKLAVAPLKAVEGVSHGVAELYTDALVAELRRHPGISVVSDSDIAAVLGVEKRKALLGCSDASCIAEIGGALGVDRVVYGSVGRIGQTLLIYLTEVDTRRAQAMATANGKRTQAGDDALLELLPGLVAQLLAEPAK